MYTLRNIATPWGYMALLVLVPSWPRYTLCIRSLFPGDGGDQSSIMSLSSTDRYSIIFIIIWYNYILKHGLLVDHNSYIHYPYSCHCGRDLHFAVSPSPRDTWQCSSSCQRGRDTHFAILPPPGDTWHCSSSPSATVRTHIVASKGLGAGLVPRLQAALICEKNPVETTKLSPR